MLLYRSGTWGLQFKVTGPRSNNQLVEYQQGFSARPHPSFAVSLPGRAGVCEQTQAWGCGERGWLHKQHGLLGGVHFQSLHWGHSPPKLQRGSDLSSLSWLWPGLGSAKQSQAGGVGPREVPRKAWQLAPLQGFAVPTPPWLQSLITGGSWNVSIIQATEWPLPPIQCLRVPRFLFILFFWSLQAVEQGEG